MIEEPLDVKRSFRLERSLDELLERQARIERRSTSSLCRLAVLGYLESATKTESRPARSRSSRRKGA